MAHVISPHPRLPRPIKPGRIKIARAAMALFLVASCGSCSRGFEILPSGFGTNIRLMFTEGGWFTPTPKQACLTELTVSEEQWPTRGGGPVVWRIRAVKGCVTITGADVGHVPDGFTADINQLPLKTGHMYGARAEADPYGGGSMAWFVCREAPAVAEWKNMEALASPPQRCGR